MWKYLVVDLSGLFLSRDSVLGLLDGIRYRAFPPVPLEKWAKLPVFTGDTIGTETLRFAMDASISFQMWI